MASSCLESNGIFAASLKSLLPSLEVEQLASTIVGLQQEDA